MHLSVNDPSCACSVVSGADGEPMMAYCVEHWANLKAELSEILPAELLTAFDIGDELALRRFFRDRPT